MFRLAYLSHAVAPFAHTDLADVLSVSRQKNPVQGITGMLIFHSGVFLQFLEGSESAVRETYARIERDPRHHSARILSEGPAQSPAFSNWSMGFIAPDALPAHLQASVRDLRNVAARVQETPEGLSEGKQAVAALIKRFLERAEPELLS